MPSFIVEAIFATATLTFVAVTYDYVVKAYRFISNLIRFEIKGETRSGLPIQVDLERDDGTVITLGVRPNDSRSVGYFLHEAKKVIGE